MAQTEYMSGFQRFWTVQIWKIITFSSGLIRGWTRPRFKDNSTCFDRKISENSWKTVSDFKAIFRFVTIVLPAGDKTKQGIFLVFLRFYGSTLESLTFERPWLTGKSGMSITNSFAQPRSNLGQWNSPLIIPLKVLTQIQGTNVSGTNTKPFLLKNQKF